jgi:hypothetical protein
MALFRSAPSALRKTVAQPAPQPAAPRAVTDSLGRRRLLQAGVAAGGGALAAALARPNPAAADPTNGLVLEAASKGVVPLTLKGAPQQEVPMLRTQDSSGAERFSVDWDGNLYVGSGPGTVSYIRFRGRQEYANPWHGGNWEMGLDVGNTPTYRDFVLAERLEPDGSGSDFVYVHHGTTKMPTLGVGAPPPFGGKGALEASIWGNTAALPFHTIVAHVKEWNEGSPQTGRGIVVQQQSGDTPFEVDTWGRVKASQFTMNSGYFKDLYAGLYVHAAKPDGIGAVVRARNGQSENIMEIQSPGSTTLGGFNKSGYLFTRMGGAPDDSDVGIGQVMMWFDRTPGKAAVRFKGRDGGGVVRTGSVDLR